jgi:chromosome segregation ATPase
MSNIKLNVLTIRNFKGLRQYQLILNGDDYRIRGENETRKTTIKDAFHWLLFDKNADGKPSSGKGHFGLRPHDDEGNELHDVVVTVEMEMDFDGEIHILTKEQTEKTIKGRIVGYPNQYYIDGAPVLKKDYDEFINERVPEEIFKLLTDVFYFCGELPYQKRREFLVKYAEGREFLVKYAEGIDSPEGFEGLKHRANNRNLQDYKKVLLLQRDGNKDREGHKAELDKIPTRIETIREGLIEAETGTGKLNQKRFAIKGELQKLRFDRSQLTTKEADRQKQIDYLNQLNANKMKREGELANDMSGIQSLLDEKRQIEIEVANAKEAIAKAEAEFRTASVGLINSKNEIESLMATRNNIFNEYQAAKSAPQSNVCYACGQDLPDDKLKENEEKRNAKLSKIKARGNKIKQTIDERKEILTGLEKNIKTLQQQEKDATSNLKEIEDKASKRFVEIQKAINNRPVSEPVQDEAWQKICAEIAEVEKSIGKAISGQITAIDNQISNRNDEIAELDKALAQADRAREDKTRIEKLEQREKELAQLIADIDKELDLIKQYNLAYSKMVENAVNDKFQYVSFKLFDIQINGEIDDRVCENGTPWIDMSTGQSIRAGLDVINTLSNDYGMSVPLFIDHAESMTMPIQTIGQVIELYAEKGVRKLQVEKIETTTKAVA